MATRVLKVVLSFDGVDDYIDVPDSASLKPSEITVSAWVLGYIPTGARHSLIVTKGDSHSPTYGYSLRYGFSYDIRFMLGNGITNNGTTAYTVDKFPAFVVGTYDGSVAKLYVDGVLRQTKTLNWVIAHGPQRLGVGGNPDAEGRYLKGIIGEVRVYNRALSASEIQSIYQSGTLIRDGLILWFIPSIGNDPNIIYDQSGSGNHGTLYGGMRCPVLKV